MRRLSINDLVCEVIETSGLNEASYFDASVFYYLSGRYPELTIQDAVEIVSIIRDKIIQNG